MSSYRKTVEALAEQVGDRLPCRTCQTPTQLATLAQYGALCFSCFEDYCRAPQPSLKRPDTPQQAEMRKRVRTRTLDAARAGFPVSTETITRALMASGEITPPSPSEFAMAGWVEDRGQG